MKSTLIITCEHASNKIPAEFEQLYASIQDKLDSHYGYDLHAKSIFDALITTFDCHHQAGCYSRLLIDLNRTLDYKKLFSIETKLLHPMTKDKIIQLYYLPYFNQLQQWVSDSIAQARPVLHLSIHTFTPILNGKTRTTDIGLLYDPLHTDERDFCLAWRRQIEKITDIFTVKMNYPYRGNSNGLTTHFRKKYSATLYRGIEVECNQKIFDTQSGPLFIEALQKSLKSLFS